MDTDGPQVLETAGALNVRYKGRLLYSERGPLLSAQRIAQAADLGPGRLYLVPSPLLWHGVPELLARISEDSAILCVEAEASLASLARDALPPDLAEEDRLTFLGRAEPAEALAAAARLGRFRRVVLVKLSGGEAFHRQAYGDLAHLLQEEFTAGWRSQATLLSMGRLWARNIFRNVAALPDLDLASTPRFTKPLAVCGAGPSLEAGLDFLGTESKKGRLQILACDTALGSLVQAGIRPDLVVCLEGQAHNLPDFVPAAGSGLALLGDLSSHPASYGILGGKVHLCAVDILPSVFLARLKASLAREAIPCFPCPPLGSVGVHGLHLARSLGTGPVLALGLDFAFEPGKTHARGSPSLLGEARRQDRLHPWPNQVAAAFRPGVRQAPAGLLTDPVLASYGALLAEAAQGPGPRVYDLRARGLDLGLAALSLGEASKMLAEYADPGLDPGEVGPSPASREARATFARGFLDLEIQGLLRIEGRLRGRQAWDKEAFLGLMAGHDYLAWPLPDSGRLGDLPQDLLNRLVVEVEYWLWKLGDIRASVG